MLPPITTLGWITSSGVAGAASAGNGDWSNIRVTVDENSTQVHIPGIDVRVMDDGDLDESIDDLTDGDGSAR